MCFVDLRGSLELNGQQVEVQVCQYDFARESLFIVVRNSDNTQSTYVVMGVGEAAVDENELSLAVFLGICTYCRSVDAHKHMAIAYLRELSKDFVKKHLTGETGSKK